MAQTVCVIPSAADLTRLSAIVADRGRPLKHIQRARIILLSAKRLSVLDVAQQAGVSRPAVWPWQQRYAEEGVESLLRDKTRPPGKPPHATDTVAEVLALTCSEPPGEVTQWTAAPWRRPSGSPCGRSSASGMPIASSRIGCAASNARTIRPSPRRSRTSSGSPWIRRATPSCSPSTILRQAQDEESQIQALARTRPKPARHARSPRDTDPRRRPPRHHDPVCRARRAGGHGDRSTHGIAVGEASKIADAARPPGRRP